MPRASPTRTRAAHPSACVLSLRALAWASIGKARAPWTRVIAQQRVEQDVLVPAVVEESAAHRDLQHEATLLGDPSRGRVLRDDDEVQAVLLLRREQVVDKQLD